MIITKISVQQRDPNRVNVFIDGQYTLSLTLDQILEYKLKVGEQLDEIDKKKLIKASEDGKLRSRTLEWLMVRPRSRAELETYLHKKNADDEFSTKLIQECIAKNYQNDEAFARWWIDNRVRKNKSNLAIKAELSQKGVSKAIIEGALSSVTSQKDRLKEVIKQKGSLAKYQADPNKFKKYLLSKGFSYSDIVEVLAEDNDEAEGSF